MPEYFGIDFGTTNSAVVGRLRRNVTLYDDGNQQPIPSLVAVDLVTGQVRAVGREAWNRRKELLETCQIFSSAKMYLGTGKIFRIGSEIWTYERVVTEILKGLRQRVRERSAGSELDEPVMAIPVGFSPEKRRALRKSAEDAGMRIQGFVSEPTAAVYRNFPKVNQWPTVVVFDWGGGTLDISVVSINGDTVKEIATLSMKLGGDDLDIIFAEWAHMQILREKNKKDSPFSGIESRYRDMLISECENAKRKFAVKDIVKISIANYGAMGTVNLEIKYDDFSSLMRPKIDDALATLEEAVINRAHLSFDQIGGIVMVGGSSNLRGLIQAMDERNWSCEKIDPPNSEWNVADGAAMLASNFGDYVCAQNVGVRLCDNTIFPIIEDGKKIDYNVNVTTFGLVEDTNNARFVFVENKNTGDVHLSTMDRVLGHLSVPAYGFTNEPISLESRIDENLLLHVNVRSECRGKKHEKKWIYPELRFNYKLPI